MGRGHISGTRRDASGLVRLLQKLSEMLVFKVETLLDPQLDLIGGLSALTRTELGETDLLGPCFR